jgi:PAS domain S-box-containing protein
MSTSGVPRSDVVSSVPVSEWHDNDCHVVHFYAEDGYLLDTLSRYVGTALGAGDSAVVIATRAHRDGLWTRLSGRGFDVHSAAQRGRYVSLDAAETLESFLVNGYPDQARFAEVIGDVLSGASMASENKCGRVAAFGEMVALLWAQGKVDQVIRLEELWNDLAKVHSFSLRCAYPISSFFRAEDGDALLRICGQHSGVIPGESYTSLASEDEKLRNITHLQQKAQALDTERAERQQIEISLQVRESELADFLENALEGVQQVGPEGKILWANKALLQLLGYSAEEYVNRRLAEFHADAEVFDEFWGKLMRREDVCNFPADLRCKDGSLKHVLIQSNGVWQDGRFVRTRCFVRDVTEQKRAEEALRESEASLRSTKETLETLVQQRTAALQRLSAQVLNLQDRERRRIARELHDSLGQYLTALKINIEILKSSPHLNELWEQSEQLMQRCMSEVRTLSYLLYPPMMDEVGLASTARWYVQGFGERSGLDIKLQIPRDLERLPDAIELALFRVLQEALTNVHRHSRATSARVVILRDAEQVILEVSDNGHGIPKQVLRRFNESAALIGVGLTGMREIGC